MNLVPALMSSQSVWAFGERGWQSLGSPSEAADRLGRRAGTLWGATGVGAA